MLAMLHSYMKISCRGENLNFSFEMKTIEMVFIKETIFPGY